MPGGSRTGPMGMGPRTGRAAGYCAGFDMPGYTNAAPGRGSGGGSGRSGGFGGGRGRRNRFYATGVPGQGRFGGVPRAFGPVSACSQPDTESERQTLQRQAEALEAEMAHIKKRLEALGTE